MPPPHKMHKMNTIDGQNETHCLALCTYTLKLKVAPIFRLVYNRFPIREAHKNLYLPFHGTLQKSVCVFFTRVFALRVCLPIYISSVFSYVSISHSVSGVEDKWQRKNRRRNDSPFAHAESNTNNKTWAKKDEEEEESGRKKYMGAHVHNSISLAAVASSFMLFVIREAEALRIPKYDH